MRGAVAEVSFYNFGLGGTGTLLTLRRFDRRGPQLSLRCVASFPVGRLRAQNSAAYVLQVR